MKDYVYIQSAISIVVTAGLQNENVTNLDSDIPNRLKVNPTWHKLKLMVKAGRHIYPSLITEWPSVKALVKDGILTIGEETDTDDGSIIEAKEDLSEALAETKKTNKSKKVKDINLEDISE